VTNAESLDLIKKLIFVEIVAIELQRLQSHLSEIRYLQLTRFWNHKSSPRLVQVYKD